MTDIDVWHTDQGKRLPSRVDESMNGSASAPGSPRGISRSSSGLKGSLNIDESTRQKVRDRIAAGLGKNPNLGTGKQKVDEIASACEEKCFQSCASRYAISNLMVTQSVRLPVCASLQRGLGARVSNRWHACLNNT